MITIRNTAKLLGDYAYYGTFTSTMEKIVLVESIFQT